MQLKRYSNEELQEMFTEIFYDYMSTEDSEHKTPAHYQYDIMSNKLKEYIQRAKEYTELLSSDDLNKDSKESIEKQLEYLKTGIDYIANSNIENQKKLYEETGSVDFARSIVRVPLDKKINSYYDDFVLDVVFYDDVCVLNGKFDTYKALETKEARINFLKSNTEITHFGMAWIPNNQLRAIIEVKNKLNYDDKRVADSGVALLPKKFSNFETLTLKDTNEIENNDLKQFIQTKIDLDKENMELLSSQIIRGDEYKIYKVPEEDDFYIRYVCRSTGRVYYNRLNLNNLQLSCEFQKDDYDSYSRAWWNLNTLGGDVDGKPVIRC